MRGAEQPRQPSSSCSAVPTARTQPATNACSRCLVPLHQAEVPQIVHRPPGRAQWRRGQLCWDEHCYLHCSSKGKPHAVHRSTSCAMQFHQGPSLRLPPGSLHSIPQPHPGLACALQPRQLQAIRQTASSSRASVLFFSALHHIMKERPPGVPLRAAATATPPPLASLLNGRLLTSRSAPAGGGWWTAQSRTPQCCRGGGRGSAQGDEQQSASRHEQAGRTPTRAAPVHQGQAATLLLPLPMLFLLLLLLLLLPRSTAREQRGTCCLLCS